MPRSRSLTRLTIRVGLLHFGQSVLLDVSITFLRSAVLAILAMETLSPLQYHCLCLGAFTLGSAPTKLRGRTSWGLSPQALDRCKRTSTRSYYLTTSCNDV